MLVGTKMLFERELIYYSLFRACEICGF